MSPVSLLFFPCLVLGLTAGFVMHRADYCLVAAFRDLFLFRSTFMLRNLALSAVAAMVLFDLARVAGILPIYPFLLLPPPSLAGALGGFVFGVGMVLAGGCVAGTLYKMGAGSVLGWTAFAGLVAGSALYAEVHTGWRRLADAAAFWPAGVTLPRGLRVSPSWLVIPLAAASGICFLRWARAGKWTRRSPARGYLQPWKASLVLAAVNLAFYALVAMPMGITTFYVKLAAWAEELVLPAHVQAVAYFATTPLDVALPGLGLRLQGGPGPGWDAIASVQGATVLGIVLGAFASACLLREFRMYVRVPGRQYASAFLGGALVALGSRMASGCNVWHLLGGIPVAATQSLLFVAGLVPGAWLGTRLLAAGVLGAVSCGSAPARPAADRLGR